MKTATTAIDTTYRPNLKGAFHGFRLTQTKTWHVVHAKSNGFQCPLRSRQSRNQLPELRWGDDSAGSAELAITLLTIVAGAVKASELYQDFHRECIYEIDRRSNWSIAWSDIDDWVFRQEVHP